MRRIHGLGLLVVVTATSAAAQDLPELKQRGTLRVIVGSSNLVERFNLAGPASPASSSSRSRGPTRLPERT